MQLADNSLLLKCFLKGRNILKLSDFVFDDIFCAGQSKRFKTVHKVLVHD